MNTTIRSLALLVGLAGTGPHLAAQPATPPTSMRVTLVAGVEPSKGGRTEVVRRARVSPNNVVIVDRNATADDLGAALAMLSGLQAQFGDTSTFDLRARPEHVRPGPKWESSAYRKWLHEQLLRLRRAGMSELTGFGAVQSVQITVPLRTGVLSTPTGAP